MSENYGVTPTGFVKKRLDTIVDEIHDALTRDWGVNTRYNPKSYLNVLVTDFADKIAELWEVAEESYFAKYPASAEGASLDHAAEFGGSTREQPQPSYYQVKCTGKNGTKLPALSVLLESETDPKVRLKNYSDAIISNESCCKIVFVPQGVGADYNINIDHVKYSAVDFAGAKTAMENSGYDTSYDEQTGRLTIDFGNTSKRVIYGINLRPVEVASINSFGTEAFGDIQIAQSIDDKGNVRPATVTVKSAPDQMTAAELIEGYDAGRLLETDTEFRRSYIDKIFIRSRTMLESIASAILQNVPEVVSCEVYQNDTHVYQKHRPPHSVEVIVDCPKNDVIYKKIAEQILATKAAGIQTCNCAGLIYNSETDAFGPIPALAEAFKDYAHEEIAYDDYGTPVPVRFTTPVHCDVDFAVTIRRDPRSAEAVNTEELIETVIKRNVNVLKPGEDLIPAKWLYQLYQEVPGITMFDVKLSYTKYTCTYNYGDVNSTSAEDDSVTVDEKVVSGAEDYIGVPENYICKFGALTVSEAKDAKDEEA